MWANEFNAKMKPITEAQKKYHKEHSAKYIFVTDKDGNAECSRCDSKFNIGHTKHLSDAVCPSCGKTLKIQHTWRMKKDLEIIRFMVIPKVLSSHQMVLRYLLAYSHGYEPIEVTEVAREYLDEYHYKPEYYTYTSTGYYDPELKEVKYTPIQWTRGKGTYFRTDSYMCPNRFWCRTAYEYPRNFFKEINKLECFKYYPAETEYEFYSYPSQLLYLMRSARLNEQLYKAGLNRLAGDHRSYFCNNGDRCYSQNYKATSLIDRLKLNKQLFNLLREHESSYMLGFLQSHRKTLNINNFEMVECSIEKYDRINNLSETTGVSFKKMFDYLNKHIKNSYEYSHYLWVLKEMEYNLHDTYYSMPKNFKKADKKLSDEYTAKLERERAEEERVRLMKLEEKDVLIKKISDGIKSMPNLQEFLNGSKGFLVYVPESSKDLIDEGKQLHNCIGTYVDRIAQGKTLVFFLRQLDNPTAPFVAFEYYDGKVVQVRYDHNETVTDDNIIQFVNRFAETLKASA